MSSQTLSQAHESQNDELEEEEVHQMAEKVAEYRATLPDQLKTTLASLLASQRPSLELHFDVGSQPQPGLSHAPASDVGAVEPETVGSSLTREEQEEDEKVQLLKQMISSNASAIPQLLKRMKECMARMDKLRSHNGVIHPAFKRKRKD